MKRSVPFVLVALAILFALPAAAAEPASMAAAPEAPPVAVAEPGACAGATGTAAVLLAASAGNLAPALGIPEPSPQHCTDCCPFLFVQECRQNCPSGCHCGAQCLDCDSHWCECEEICGP